MGLIRKIKDYAKKQQEKADINRTRQAFQDKLDMSSRADLGKKARKELKELRADERNKKSIAELQAYKQRQRQGSSPKILNFEDDFFGEGSRKGKGGNDFEMFNF